MNKFAQIYFTFLQIYFYSTSAISVKSTFKKDVKVSILAQLGTDYLMTCSPINNNSSKVTVFSMTQENNQQSINISSNCKIISELKGEGSFQYIFYGHSQGFDKIALTYSQFSGMQLSKYLMLSDSSYDVSFFQNLDSFNFIIGTKAGKLYFYNPILFKDEFKGCQSEIKGVFYSENDDIVLAGCGTTILIWNKKSKEGIWNWDYQIQNTIEINSPIDEFYSLEPVKERLLVVRSQNQIYIYWFQSMNVITLMNTKIISQAIKISKAYGNKIITLESDNQLRIYDCDSSSLAITTFGSEHKDIIQDFVSIKDTQGIASIDKSGSLIQWQTNDIELISCSKGSYLNNNQLCQKCNYTCETCQNQNSCLSCNKDFNRVEKPINNQCNCLENYFDFSINQKCEKCHSTCLTCSSAKNLESCLSCDTSDSENGNRIIQTQQNKKKCICKDGFYEDITTKKCKKCSNSCQTCSSFQVCTSCNTNPINNRLNLNSQGQCNCQPGYFDDGKSIQCQKCHFSCQNCEKGNNSNSCTTCYPNIASINGLQVNINRLNINNQNQCKCKEGYYDIENNIVCEQCSSNCLTCSGSDKKCNSCSIQQNRVLNNQTFICECIPGYYQDPNSNNCIKCPYNCKTCISSEVCLTCENQNNTFRKDISLSNKCECMDGYFDDGQNIICVKCPFNCKTCKDRINCLSCDQSLNRKHITNSSKCECLDGYFDNHVNKICNKCDYQCKTCLKQGECMSCSSEILDYRQPLNQQNKCLCQPGYYDDGHSANCQKCPNNCQTCDSQGDCLSCPQSIDSHRTQNIINGKCQCEDGFYDDLIQTNCQKCHPNCKTCNGPNPDQCTSCEINNERMFQQANQTCPCLLNYKDIGQPICEIVYSCHFSCKYCSGPTKNDCLECSNLRIKSSDIQNEGEQCICQKGYFEQGETCQKCDISCLECNGSGPNHCLTCDSSQNKQFNIQTSSCDCFLNFFYDQPLQKCVQCNPYCQTCNGSTKNHCLTCYQNQGRIISGNKCECDNKNNYFEVYKQDCFKKLPCYSSCKDCAFYDPNLCESCLDDNAFLTEKKECFCKEGYFQNKKDNGYQCQQCSSNCRTCQEKSNKCTSCFGNLLLNQDGICKDQFPTKLSNETIKTVYNVTEQSAFVSIGTTATASIILSIASPNGNLFQQFLTLQKLNFLLLLDVAYPEILYVFFKAVSGATPVKSLQNFNILYNYLIPDNLKQEGEHQLNFERKKLDSEKINSNIFYNAGGTVTFYIITWILFLPVLFLYKRNKLIRGELEIYSSFANYLKKIYEKIVSLIFLQVHEILTLVIHLSVYVSYVQFIVYGNDNLSGETFIFSTLAFHIYSICFILLVFYLINYKSYNQQQDSSVCQRSEQIIKDSQNRRKWQWLLVMRQHLVSDFITSDKVCKNFKLAFFLVESCIIPAIIILLFRHFTAQIILCLTFQFLLFVYAAKKRPHSSKLNNFLLITDQLSWVLIFILIGVISITIDRCLKNQYISDSDIDLIDSISQAIIFICFTMMFMNPFVTIIKLIMQLPTILKKFTNIIKKYKSSKKQLLDITSTSITKEDYSRLRFQNKKTIIQCNKSTIQLNSSYILKNSQLLKYQQQTKNVCEANSEQYLSSGSND